MLNGIFLCGATITRGGGRSAVRKTCMENKRAHQILRTTIHEAAREGIVPLCEDDVWNPKDAPASPRSGLMRQPTKEGSVWNIPEFN